MSDRPPHASEPSGAIVWKRPALVLALVGTLVSCGGKKELATPESKDPVIFRVGSLEVLESDLAQHLKEYHAGRNDSTVREEALRQLIERAQLVQSALAANMDRDPSVRAEFARLLASRYKEKALVPKLKALESPIPEQRLRELYLANESRYRTHEKRQVAVLWLDAGKDAERAEKYQAKLAAARDWYFKSGDLEKHPDQGFAVLSVDYSEHPSSRYKGGIVGWLEREGGMDPWTKAVAEILYTLKTPGEVSGVVTRDEGVFLVRYMAQAPALQRPFESVSDEIQKAEANRLKQQAEIDFKESLATLHPVEKLAPAAASK